MVERSAALLLMIAALPLMVALAAAVMLLDGPPVLYRGRRLGLRKRLFTIYKIRTLRRDAAQLTSGRLLRPTDGLEIPGGQCVRDARLDELPQLWNVVRGDMRFVGPRPERALVYRNLCRGIPGYARRFEVRPGILGPSQVFTPHSTPKRIRAWLDASWARRHRSLGDLAGLTACTVTAMAGKVLERSCSLVVDELLNGAAWRRSRTRRRLRRVRPPEALVHIAPLGRRFPQITTSVVDLNERSLLVRGRPEWARGEQASLSLEIALDPRSGSRLMRSADCRATFVGARDGALLFDLAPENPRSDYVLHQYFLGEALAPPRRRGGRGAAARDVGPARPQSVPAEREVSAGSWS